VGAFLLWRPYLLGYVRALLTTMTWESNMRIYRQGDVLITEVASLPADVTVAPRDDGDIILAYGEVTRHAHRISAPKRHANLYRSQLRPDWEAKYLTATAPIALRHEEHRTVTIPAGTYRVTIHREYQPGDLPRTVED
jgi:hypothetical protein